MVSSVHSFDTLRLEYEALYGRMVIEPHRLAAARWDVKRITSYKPRYLSVEKETLVPWYWTGLMHLREADLNFHAWLHNGDPMFDHHHEGCRTVHVPRGRPPNPACSWEDGAIDCLQQIGIAGIPNWTPARCAWAWERGNGWGYRDYHHIPSPYLWGGTNVQKPGKYTEDHEFDPSVMDEQLGTMAVLKLILEAEVGNAESNNVDGDKRSPGNLGST